MTSLYKPIKLILECYYMSNGLAFEMFNYFASLGFDREMAFATFQGNWLRIDRETSENHSILVARF